MQDYQSNSHRSRESTEEKRLTKVVTGSVRPKKKSNTEKLAELFLPEDVENLKTYVVRDILIPAGKKAVSEIIDMFLYGSTGRSSKGTNASKVSYRSYYENSNDRRTATAPSRPSTGYHYDDIVFDNRGEAEEVLVSMEECIATYGMVTVRDFYDLVGVTGNHTDQKYGWLDLRTASVVRLRMGEGGYMIKLPRAVPLN